MKTKLCKCGCGKELTKHLQKYFSYQCMYKAEGFKVKKAKPYIRKPIKKRKKSSCNSLLDTLWSKAVKILAEEKCEFSGNVEHLNSHHIFGRNNYAVRWDVRNGVCLSVRHHTFSNSFSAHRTPTVFTSWIKDKRGQEWYNDLEIRALQNRDKPDKEKLLIELKTIVYGPRTKLPF